MMCVSGKTFYGGDDLEVSRARAGRKEKELLYFHMCVSTYHLYAKKKKKSAVLSTLALPYLLSLFPFFPKERKKTKTTAQNRNCVKGSSLRQVPTGSSKGTRAKLIVGSESGPALCSSPPPRSSAPQARS